MSSVILYESNACMHLIVLMAAKHYCSNKMTVTVIAVFKLTLAKSQMHTNVTVIIIQW